jgi:hypothetical protein
MSTADEKTPVFGDVSAEAPLAGEGERVAFVGGRPEVFKVQPDTLAILRLREALGDAVRELGVDVVEEWLAEAVRRSRKP